MGELLSEKDHDEVLNISETPDKLSGVSDSQLLDLKDKAESLYQFFHQMQLVTKELCNSVYGGVATNSLRYFNPNTAMDITAEGRHSNQMMEKVSWNYLKRVWHKDYEFHKELEDRFPDLMNKKPSPITSEPTNYGDTDSVSSDTLINTENGHKKIEEIFNDGFNEKQTMDGSQHKETKDKVLNWTDHEGLKYHKPKSIIRHKVNKEKWKLKTKGGKEIIVTGDHSLIVFRKNKKIKIKAKDININTDKIMRVYKK